MFLLRASLVRLCNGGTGIGETLVRDESRLSLLFLILLGLITSAWLLNKTDDEVFCLLKRERCEISLCTHLLGPPLIERYHRRSQQPQLSKFFCSGARYSTPKTRRDTEQARIRKGEEWNRKESRSKFIKSTKRLLTSGEMLREMPAFSAELRVVPPNGCLVYLGEIRN